MPCHIFFCCLLEVDSLWTSNVLHLECCRERCEQLEPQDIWWTALWFVGWGWVGGLMEPKVVVVKSCTSVQCFNTLLVLFFHIVGSSLGTKCFSVLCSTLISSVQGSRLFGLIMPFSEILSDQKGHTERTSQTQSQHYNMVHGHWFFSQFITLNSVLPLSTPVLQLILLNETRDCMPVCFPFLLSSVLPGICFVQQTAASCCSPRFPGSSSTLGLGFLLLLEAASSFQWASTIYLPVLLKSLLPFSGLFSSHSLTFPSLLFLSQK